MKTLGSKLNLKEVHSGIICTIEISQAGELVQSELKIQLISKIRIAEGMY